MTQDARRAASAPADSGISARAVALDMVSGVLRRGRAMDEEPCGFSALVARDRAFARAIAAMTLRRLGQIDDLIAACVERASPARDGIVHDILRIAVAQLVFLGTAAHAAVGTAVDLAGRRGKPRYAGLVNAVLRRLAREGAATLGRHDEARLNTPDAFWRSWAATYGEDTARKIARAHLKEPPLDLTVKSDAEAWAAKLEAELLPTGTLRRKPGGAVADLPGFAEGAWWVQDAAAALPAKLLGNIRGKPAIDLCAAPGGKTMQLAAMGARVTAVDISSKRLERVKQNLARTGLDAALVAADATSWRPLAPAPFVLLDAPCTATGTIRRHPDIQRLKTQADIDRLARTQDRLLANAAGMLAGGGVLVYAVCSLEPAEGPARVEALLEAAPSLRRMPILTSEVTGLREAITPGGDLRTLPCHWTDRGGIDGFYAARLRRAD
ncbi:MAG: RsmB/NOP family class I SAM-dependent RNA methyltransferase [Rhodospirillales bacterium]